ncbi:hypothetical protein [Rhizobium sp. BK376]|jgi:hypothetical protein|uniref:hypothetical protein n=1 Tax=Rhizobium sp. BK376 TaxID=2512149 RepID=UPI0010535BE2|nr:hypothetical protein [Rhizobium sp. BK376]TCR82162.1 hypothetical protein EV561_11165 [Rhizobium sp. BK376]
MSGRQTGWKVVVRMFCAAALLFLGLAHQAPAAAEDNGSGWSAYQLPDGSVPTLCISIKDSDGKIVIKPGCEVCRLAGSIILPDPDDGAWLTVSHAFLLNPLGEAGAIFGNRTIMRANSRAPPLFL